MKKHKNEAFFGVNVRKMAFLSILTPNKHHQNYFLTKIDSFSFFARIFGIKKDIFKLKDMKALKLE